MRTSAGNDMSPAPNKMENDYLAVTIHGDGTLAVTDKATGRCYPGLHFFEDAGDVGDYWAYYPAYENEIHTSIGSVARIWCEENGPLCATYGVEVTMRVPAFCDRSEGGVKGDSRRSKATRDLVITSRVSLSRNAKRVAIRTVVNNTVEDHRLRVMFPTHLNAAVSHAAGHFTVDERPVDPQRMPDGTFYPEMQTHPQQMFASLSDGRNGFSVVNNCFTEFEVLRDEERTLAITLFRSMRNRICTEFRTTGAFPRQKGGQCLRTMEFAYAIYTHQGTWVDGNVYRQAEELNVPPTVYQTAPHNKGTWPLEQSLFAVEPNNLVMSALKQACDRKSFVMRLFNPTNETVDGIVRFNVDIKRAYKTNMNETRIEEIRVAADNILSFDVGKGKIVTIEIEV
jgi:mannosylglycerate hydrolase